MDAPDHARPTSGPSAADQSEHLATLVVDTAITKLDALAVVALTVDGVVSRAGTSRPFIRLTPDAWAEIDIPKFGEPPPLAIDVHSTASVADARRQASALAEALGAQTGWRVIRMFDEGTAS